MLSAPILEQLQSFNIPIHCFDHYHNVVSRFHSLELIQFTTSGALKPIFDDDAETDSDVHSESDGKSGKEYMMQRRNELIQNMKLFVHDFVQLFKGRLKPVRRLEDDVWRMMFGRGRMAILSAAFNRTFIAFYRHSSN